MLPITGLHNHDNIPGRHQGRTQPLTPGWARHDKNIPSIFPHFPIVSLVFPLIFVSFFLILAFRMDGTREGPILIDMLWGFKTLTFFQARRGRGTPIFEDGTLRKALKTPFQLTPYPKTNVALSPKDLIWVFDQSDNLASVTPYFLFHEKIQQICLKRKKKKKEKRKEKKERKKEKKNHTLLSTFVKNTFCLKFLHQKTLFFVIFGRMLLVGLHWKSGPYTRVWFI